MTAPAGTWSRAVGVAVVAMAATAVVLLVPGESAAQEVHLELSAGAAVGNYTDSGAGLDLLPQPSLAVALEVWPTETLAGYVAFNRSSFGCEEGFCVDRDVTMTSQGLMVGGRWSAGLPWVSGGVGLQTLNMDAVGGEGSTDAALGFELGAGLELGLWQQIRIRPGVRYLRHGAATDFGEGHVALIAFELGVVAELVSF